MSRLLTLAKNHPGLGLALGIYLSLALSYFFIVPIFEGPDEWTHTGHVAYLAEGNGLPVMLPGQGIWGGQQPPLYYAMGALLVQPFKTEGVTAYHDEEKNPHSSLGYALDPGNKNHYLHGPAENFPYRGLSLTVHVLRLYSMAFGVVALIFAYFTALEIYDLPSTPKSKIQNPKWLATAVACFIAGQPMFAFITASVANEPANMALCAIGLWLAQKYVLYGPGRDGTRAVALGLVLGLISLAKMTGLSFGLVAVVAMLQTAVVTRKTPGAARLLWRDGLIISTLFLAVGGWWYWRNYQLYGDFFQAGLYKLYFNVDPKPLTLDEFLYTLSTGEVSFWATFGWLNIVAPEWVYSFYRIVSRVGLIGVGLAVLSRWAAAISPSAARPPTSQVAPTEGSSASRAAEPPVVTQEIHSSLITRHASFITRHSPRLTPHASRLTRHASLVTPHSSLIIHLLFPLALAFSLTRLVAIEGGLQGRQLLPALGSLAILIVWGWWSLTPARWQRSVFISLAAGLLGVAVWLPYGVVAPAYIPEPLLTEADLPAGLPRLDWIYNDEMRLIGVSIGAEQVKPGQRVPVTAYWQALKPMAMNYSVFVHLIGRDHQNVGQFNTYPGLGLRPTTTLEPGQIVRDTYLVLVNGGSEAPTRLEVNIGLFDFKEPGRPGLQPRAPDGSRPPPLVGQLKLTPHEWPKVAANPPLAEFVDQIQLLDVAREKCDTSRADCQLTFTWRALDRPATGYTVFIQLWPESPPVEGPAFFGFDGPPLNNDYPTYLWAAGEIIVDPHRLDLTSLPAGQYQILAGLYHLQTGVRLPARANGELLPDDAVRLGTLSLK